MSCCPLGAHGSFQMCRMLPGSFGNQADWAGQFWNIFGARDSSVAWVWILDLEP